MRKNIINNKEDYLVKIFSYIQKNFSKMNKKEFLEGLLDLIYQLLEKTYSITSQMIKELYNIRFDEIIDKDTLKNLTYSKDGKTLYERLELHYDKAKENNRSEYFQNRIILIVDTETLYASNHILHGKLKKIASYVEVIGDSICENEEEGMCEYYTSKGKIPIEELKDLPPFHPDCECKIIYYIE